MIFRRCRTDRFHVATKTTGWPKLSAGPRVLASDLAPNEARQSDIDRFANCLTTALAGLEIEVPAPQIIERIA